VHIIHSPNLAEFSSVDKDLHESKIRRFYALFIDRMGGALMTFSGACDHLGKLKSAQYQKISFADFDKGNGKLNIYELKSAKTFEAEQVLQANLWKHNIETNPAAPSINKLVGPVEIGLRWNKNIDLDLYAKHDDELSFHQTASERYGGRYLQDIRVSPKTAYETIIYTKPVNLRDLKIFVNHYEGAATGPIDVEVRIRADGRIYFAHFKMPGGSGTRGGGIRSGTGWHQVDPLNVVGLTPVMRTASK